MNRRTFLQLTSLTLAGAPLSGCMTPQSEAPPKTSHTDQTLLALFKDPPTTARPFVRWWWNGNRVVKEELLRELDLLKAAGIGGVEINSIEFPETADPMQFKAMDWLSPEWLEMLETAVRGAKERGMICDIIVGSGWPFGGEFLTPPEQTQMLTPGTRNLKGPARVEISRQALLDEVEPPIMSKRKEKLKELVGLRLAPAHMDQFHPGLDLAGQLQRDTITIDVPAGDHVLYSLVKLTGYESVIHGAPGANGPVLNHFNKAAVQKYLDRMSTAIESRLGRMGNHFRSLFVDSMELEGANWCDDMLAQFAHRRGYDLTPYLPFILFKTGRMGRALAEEYGTKLSGPALDTVNRARYDFEITKMEVFRESFFETFLAWCRKHGVKSRVQAYGREYHPLDSSLLLDLPDCETWIRADVGEGLKEQDARFGRGYTQVNKFVSSAAHLAGKNIVSCEELTNTGLVFNASLERLKITADQSNLSGVTHSIFHGFNYSPKEAPFPGWVRYGTFFNERNPWWPFLRAFTDYKARLSAVFQNATFYADIAVMHPLADEWSKFGAPWHPNPGTAYPSYVYNVWEAIHQSGSGCDYVSEHILQHATAAHGSLQYGGRAYRTLILIEVDSLQPQTAAALRRFARSGVKIVFVGREPSRAAGLPDDEHNDKLVTDAIAPLRREHTSNVLLHDAPKPDAAMLDWWRALGERLGMQPYLSFDQPHSSVSQVRYRTAQSDIYFITNSSLSQTFELSPCFPHASGTPWVWNPETGERSPYPVSGLGNRLLLQLPPAQSRLIVFDRTTATGTPFASAPLKLTNSTPINGPWSLRLDHVSGDQRSITLEHLVDFKDRPDLKAFAGTAVYKTTFRLDNAPTASWLDLGNVAGISEVTLNGSNLGVRWYGSHMYAVDGKAKPGENVLEIKITTTLGNYLKSLKDNKDGVKWTKKQPVYSTGLLGPVAWERV